MLYLGAEGFRGISLGAEWEGGVALAFCILVGEGFVFRVLGSGGQFLVKSLAVGLGEVLHEHVCRGHEGIQAGAGSGSEGVDGDNAALSALVVILVVFPESLDFLFRGSSGGREFFLGKPGGLAAQLLVHHVHEVAGALVLVLQAFCHEVAQGFPHHHIRNDAAEGFFLLVVGSTVTEAGHAVVEFLVKAAICLLEHRHGLEVGINLLLGGVDTQFLGLSLDNGAVHGYVHAAVFSKAIAPAPVDASQEFNEFIILRMLGSPGLEGGALGVVKLFVLILIEHVAELAGGAAVQGLHIALTVFPKVGGFRVGVARAVDLDVIVLDKHVAAVTVVHHQ